MKVGKFTYSAQIHMSRAKFRLFILGAGFSRPGGLPLSATLLDQVRERVRDEFRQFGWEGPLEQEIYEWCELYPGQPPALESVLAYSHRKYFLKLT